MKAVNLIMIHNINTSQAGDSNEQAYEARWHTNTNEQCVRSFIEKPQSGDKHKMKEAKQKLISNVNHKTQGHLYLQ